MRVKLGPVSIAPDPDPLAPGVLHIGRTSIRVGTGSQPIVLNQVQPPGKKAMAAADWARGARLPDQVRAL
jgi:methionyl-tRNA formyltransferase